VIDWLTEGKLYADGVVSHVFNLDDWEKAFETNDKGDHSMKVVLVP
jgi:threonine dehydrogenase-like Zn-dependent dehydrogenase